MRRSFHKSSTEKEDDMRGQGEWRDRRKSEEENKVIATVGREKRRRAGERRASNSRERNKNKTAEEDKGVIAAAEKEKGRRRRKRKESYFCQAIDYTVISFLDENLATEHDLLSTGFHEHSLSFRY